MTRQQNGDRSEARTRRIWLALQAEEILELKQMIMDRDTEAARAFFHRAVLPRVRRAAERRGITADAAAGETEESVEDLQG